jgi:AraC-like DNA-binding protein
MKYDITVHRIVTQKKGANEYIERHKHEFFHYIYGLSGVGRIVINSIAVMARKETLIMIPPHTEHEIYGVDDFYSFDIKFSCDALLTEKLSTLGYCIQKVSDYEDKLIKDIFDEAICQNYLFENYINIRMLELIFGIMRRNQQGIYMTSNGQFADSFVNIANEAKLGKLREAIIYIDNHIAKPIKIADLADLCGYNESYFSTCFKECLGCSPIRYINIKKVERAKMMMMSTDLNVTQISETLGFESIHYFSKVFKRIIGMPPITYNRRVNIDMGINVAKDSIYIPRGPYEIPIKKIVP